jgi:hypothetical protein
MSEQNIPRAAALTVDAAPAETTCVASGLGFTQESLGHIRDAFGTIDERLETPASSNGTRLPKERSAIEQFDSMVGSGGKMSKAFFNTSVVDLLERKGWRITAQKKAAADRLNSTGAGTETGDTSADERTMKAQKERLAALMARVSRLTGEDVSDQLDQAGTISEL